MEDNRHNPRVSSPKYNKAKHYFLIKYKNEKQRKNYSSVVLSLVKEHELKDFHINEEHAFKESRVMYNMKTVLKDGEYDYDLLEKRFLEYYEY